MKRIVKLRWKIHLAGWSLLALLFVTGCSPSGGRGDLIAIPTTPAEAVQTRAATLVEDAVELAAESTDFTEEIPIDNALSDIDATICAEAAAAQAELAALRAQGEDVGELEQAVAELIDELENCRP